MMIKVKKGSTSYSTNLDSEVGEKLSEGYDFDLKDGNIEILKTKSDNNKIELIKN